MVYLHIYYVTKRKWTKVLSHLVRLFQGTEYDHAGFGISDDGTRPIIINEATLDGVVATEFDKFINNHSFVVAEFKVPITREELKAIIRVISDNKGKKYSLLQLVGNAFAIFMLKCFNYKVKKNLFGNGWKKLVCSEYLGKVLTIVGGKFPIDEDFETITLKDCFNINKEITKSIRVK
jgi:hypothetical protein